MPDLGRAALVIAFLLLAYATVAGAFAAWRARRRLAASARNALVGAFGATLAAAAVLLLRRAPRRACRPPRRPGSPRFPLHVRRPPHEPRATARLHAHCILGWP